MEILIYLVKVNLYLVLFYSFYWLFLRKLTFFLLNRFYLLAALLASFMLPILQLVENRPLMPTAAEPLSQAFSDAEKVQTEQLFNWPALLLALYGIGIACMLFKLIRGLYNLKVLINQGESLKFDSYTLILLPKTLPHPKLVGSFSFFHFLVVSHADYDHCFETILRHEQIHIRQCHSLDIIFVEILKVLFWINPVLWYYKSSIRSVHEFLADQPVENKDTYAEFLVSYARRTTPEMITNHFSNRSLLRERIWMIYKKRTPSWLLSKYVFIMPLAMFTVSLTAERKKEEIINKGANDIPRYRQPVANVPFMSGVDPFVSNRALFPHLKTEPFEATHKKESGITVGGDAFKNTLNPELQNGALTGEADTILSKKKERTTYAKNWTNYSVKPMRVEEMTTSFKTGAYLDKTQGLVQKERPVVEITKFQYKFRHVLEGPAGVRPMPAAVPDTAFQQKNERRKQNVF